MALVTKSELPDGFEFYDNDNENHANTGLVSRVTVGVFDYKKAIFGLVLSALCLVAAGVVFWVYFGKSHRLFFLVHSIILVVALIIVVICLLLLIQSQKHRESIIFEETSHVRNKEIFICLMLLITGVYCMILALSAVIYSSKPNFILKTNNDGSVVSTFQPTLPTTFKFLLIPLLLGGLFNFLAIANIIYNLKYKFTMSLMSLNISLLGAFGLAFVGLMLYLWLSHSIRDQAESPFGFSMGGFAYIFVAVIILAFVNCVQAAIKRKGILAVFGLIAFLLAILGFVFVGSFWRKSRLSEVAHQELIQKNSTATFDDSTYQLHCAQTNTKSNPNFKSQECTVALWENYFEQSFWLAFVAMLSLSFLVASAVFNFALAKDDLDPPTNFILFSFSLMMLGIGIAFAGYFISMAFKKH